MEWHCRLLRYTLLIALTFHLGICPARPKYSSKADDNKARCWQAVVRENDNEEANSEIIFVTCDSNMFWKHWSHDVLLIYKRSFQQYFVNILVMYCYFWFCFNGTFDVNFAAAELSRSIRESFYSLKEKRAKIWRSLMTKPLNHRQCMVKWRKDATFKNLQIYPSQLVSSPIELEFLMQ